MRVIAGRWRGHPLRATPGRDVRPTTDRVREALFSILGDLVTGAEVADLCCGSGALGVEALSRGAASVTFVDAASRSLAAARENLQRLQAAPGEATFERGDAVAWLQRRLEVERSFAVLADPPYATDIAARLLDVLAAARVPERIVWAVIEHSADQAPALPADLRWRVDVRRYGRTGLTILRGEAI